MSSDPDPIVDTARIRGQASDIFHRLVVERDRSEQRLARAGAADPIKLITGCSALENALAATRELMRRLARVPPDSCSRTAAWTAAS